MTTRFWVSGPVVRLSIIVAGVGRKCVGQEAKRKENLGDWVQPSKLPPTPLTHFLQQDFTFLSFQNPPRQFHRPRTKNLAVGLWKAFTFGL